MRELNSFIKGECLRLIPWNIIGSLLDVGGFRNRDLQEQLPALERRRSRITLYRHGRHHAR